MALFIDKREETYYNYQLNKKEREFLAAILLQVKETLKGDYAELTDELLKVFSED